MSVSQCHRNPKIPSPACLPRKPLLVLRSLAFHCMFLDPVQMFLFTRFLQEGLSLPKLNIFLSKLSARHTQNHKPVNRDEGRAMNL